MRDYEEKSYYEIQLDNKQLILVFLAGITVCVLIFILGVMVGKGKKEAEIAALSKTQPASSSQVMEQDDQQPQEIKEGQDTDAVGREKKNRKGQKEKEKTKEGYAFYELDKTEEKDQTTEVKTESPKIIKEPETSPEGPEVKAKDVVAAPKGENSKSDLPEKGRYTVQVMATGSRAKADEQLELLKSKGYTAFLHEDKTQGGSVYKVRVGRFEDPDAARKIASRLKQDLKLETWVALLD